MLYRTFGQTGEKVSILGFGAMRLPVVEHQHDRIDIPVATDMIHYALDHGVNYVDTAYAYHGASVVSPGTSESFVGRALEGADRDRILLATKLPEWAVHTRADMDAVLANQLRELRTDHVDCYMLHGIGARVWMKMLDLGVLDFFEAAKADGRIRYAGFSFHDDYPAFIPIVDAYDWDFCQIQYNYMDVDSQAGRAGLRYAAARGLAVIVMEPVKGGRLAGRVPAEIQAIWEAAPVKRTPAEWALRFVWNDPDVSLLLSGMSTMEQVVENVRVADEGYADSLTQMELDAIDKVRAIYQERLAVDCTGCRYCMPCPAGVDIPWVFSLMNNVLLYGNPDAEKAGYHINVALGTTAKASACTKCGRCEEVCPQGIGVQDRLAECVRMFEG